MYEHWEHSYMEVYINMLTSCINPTKSDYEKWKPIFRSTSSVDTLMQANNRIYYLRVNE